MSTNQNIAKPQPKVTALEYFINTCSREHKRRYPNDYRQFAQMTRKCRLFWKTMPAENKARFETMADRDKARYRLQMKQYKEATAKKLEKDPNAPKRFLSAFFMFCGDQRSQIKSMNPTFGGVQMSKELSRLWRLAEPEVKSKYVAMSEVDKQRYERELTAYKESRIITITLSSDDEEDCTGEKPNEA